jgi:hypothetical protein
MPQVHKLRQWAGAAPALLHFNARQDAQCMIEAKERAGKVRTSPRDALSEVMDMRLGSYKAIPHGSSACLPKTDTKGAIVSFGRFDTADACLPSVLASPACSSGIFTHDSDSECTCCESSKPASSGTGFKMYKVEAWTTLRAYRTPEQIATSKKQVGSFLSTIPNGVNLDMFFEDDASGRQRFVLKKGEGDWYNILIGGGTNPAAKFLTTSQDGRQVRLGPKDTGTGRERWLIEKKGPFYHIKVQAGTNADVTYLSMASCGCKTEVVAQDDGSGRQRWVLDLPPALKRAAGK